MLTGQVPTVRALGLSGIRDPEVEPHCNVGLSCEIPYACLQAITDRLTYLLSASSPPGALRLGIMAVAAWCSRCWHWILPLEEYASCRLKHRKLREIFRLAGSRDLTSYPWESDHDAMCLCSCLSLSRTGRITRCSTMFACTWMASKTVVGDCHFVEAGGLTMLVRKSCLDVIPIQPLDAGLVFVSRVELIAWV